MLAENGLLETYTPDELPAKPLGNWKPSQTIYYRPTRLGVLVLTPQLPDTCNLRNPLATLTATQERIVSCMRCIFSKPASEVPVPGGVIAEQVATCQEKSPVQVNAAFRALKNAGLLIKEVLLRSAKSGKRPNVYRPTPEGKQWLAPQPAEDCPTQESAYPLTEKEFTSKQQRVLRCLACIHKTVAADKSLSPIRPITVRNCTGLPRGSVESTFRILSRLGYIWAYIKPGNTMTDHFRPTPEGKQLLNDTKLTRVCPLERRAPADSAYEILKSQSPRAFENGRELTDYLQAATHDGRSLLDLLKTIVRQYVSRSFPSIIYDSIDHSDITQEILLALMQSRTPLVFPDEAIRYTYGIAKHKVADVYRRAGRRSTKSTDGMGPKELAKVETGQARLTQLEPTDTIAARQAVHRLAANLKLSPLQCTILENIAFGSTDPQKNTVNAAEIAELHGVTPLFVRVTKTRLLQKLRSNETLRALWIAS